MAARLTFLGLATFWVTMNVLLWRVEYGSRSGDTPVPVELVWKKILTAPDTSSLSVYQNQLRMGYAELSTSVGQQMATLDEDKVPPEGFVKHAGYLVHLDGNVAFGDFTNRIKFDGHVQFDNTRQWQELNLKISTRTTVLELHSFATNQSVHLRLTSDGSTLERDLTFAELQNPAAILRAFAGNFADTFLGAVDLPELPAAGAQKIPWEARRTRVKFGHEYVPVYRLESSALGRTVAVEVSTLGEILRVELPGNFIAHIDDYNRP